MFTVMEGWEASGKRRTRRPLPRRYSVMPSTEVILTGAGSFAAAFAWIAGTFVAAEVWAQVGAGARMAVPSTRAVKTRTKSLPFKEPVPLDLVPAYEASR